MRVDFSSYFFTCRYQSTYMGSFQTVELIETFLNYQVIAD